MEKRAYEQADILLLLDDSGSIDDVSFKLMVSAIPDLLNSIKVKDGKFGAVTFHNTATIVSPLSSNKDLLMLELQEYRRTRGSTNITMGLQKAQDLFNSGRSKANHLLFIFTDGAFDAAPTTQIDSLKLKGVTIFAIGIGPHLKEETVQCIATFGCHYLFDSFDQLKDHFAKSPATLLKDQEANLSFKPAQSVPVAIGEPIEFDVTIENVGKSAIPANSCLVFVGSKYFRRKTVFLESPIERGKSSTIAVTFQIVGEDVRAEDIPCEIECALCDPSGHHIPVDMEGIPLRSEYFIKQLLEWKYPPSPPYLNILTFGIVGSGKSSFINAIITCLTNQLQSRAAVGGSSDHTTNMLTVYRLYENVAGLSTVRLNLFDLWGLTAVNFRCKQLLDVLEGRVPEGYQMKERQACKTDLADISMSQQERRIHSLLLFVPISILDCTDLLSRIKESLTIALQDYAINPLLIVTRASSQTLEEQEAIRSRLSAELVYPMNRIYLVDNYVEEKGKSFEIDRRTLAILQDAITSGFQFISTKYPTPPPSNGTTSNNNNNLVS